MVVKAAPLLYGRTYNIDYDSYFLAQPIFFSKEKAMQMFSIIQSSMDRKDFMPADGRIIFHSDGRYITYGRTAAFSELYSKCSRKAVYNRLDHENGREAYGFIGIVLDITENEQKAFELSAETLCNLYEELIQPKWSEQVRSAPAATEMRNITVTETMANPMNTSSIHSKTFGVQTAYLCNSENAIRTVIDGVFKLAYSGVQVSFCSDADDIRVQYRNVYNIITCRSENVFNSLQADFAEKHVNHAATNDVQGQAAQGIQYSSNGQEQRTVRKGSYDDQLQEIIRGGKKKQTESNTWNTSQTSQMSSNGLEKELERYRRSEGMKTNQTDKTDALLTLGVIAGVTFLVIGAINSANPIVFASVGVVTIILAGIEAKRIIERFKK